MKPPFRYTLLQNYVRLGLKIYFKHWQSVNTHHIPDEGPFIFVANHQNAFLDAILVVCGIKRNPWFLARGDVFKTPWIARLLSFMRIKPIFRFRDGHSAMRKNDRIMNECVYLLEQGECLLLFGEGNHNQPWTSRNLQRGFAHLAFQYMEKTKQDIKIVPVGIHYEIHDVFRSRVLVNYGAPISLKEITDHVPDPRDKFTPLLAHTTEKLRSLILTVPLDQDYPARKKFLIEHREHKRDMVAQLESDRELMQSWTPTQIVKPKKNLSFLNWINPLYLYGKVTHLIPQALIDYVMKYKIKDDQFIGSVKVAIGVFLIPIYYILVTILFYILTRESLWTLGFFASLPFSGLYAYDQD
jgi:1-acyl-sn-glycerol-3-phosphate acyltransferase